MVLSSDAHQVVREAAALALGKQGQEQDVDPLIGLLQDAVW
jgi:HEAT repeat protein